MAYARLYADDVVPAATPIATANSAAPSPTTRQALPTAAVIGGRRGAPPLQRLPARLALELRRALRDQRVALRHEGAAAHRAGHDHLASLAEGGRHGPAVHDGDRGGSLA